MKKLLLLFLTFVSLNVFGQIEVKEGSFHKIKDYVMLDKDKHSDINNSPMALIKISTENINAEQRRKFTFKGNLATEIDVDYDHPGEIYLYLTASEATYLEIIHDDYGKTELKLPDLCDFCGYEMVVVRKASGDDYIPQINYLVINADHNNAAIYIDGNYVGDKEGSRSFDIGSKHTWKIECELYHTESGEVTITGGDAVEINKTLRPAYGFINVTSQPESNAVVFINNERVGNTPYKSDKMPSGTYKVKLMKEMYDPVEETYVINDGMTTNADVNMSANYVNVTLTTDADSDIYLDNEFKAKGNWTGRVSLGVHYAEARKVNHKTSVQKIELKKGDKGDIVLESPQPINGHIDINSTPMKADIYIDGKHYGTTPKIISNILIGNHELRLEKEGCETLSRDIVVVEGEMLSLNEKLSHSSEKAISDKPNDNKPKVKENKEVNKVNFLTLNVTYSVASQTSFGLTYGQVKKFGWFASVMTGLDFTGFSTIDKSYNEVVLTGESRSSRLSVTAGLVARLGDTPLYAKAGAGYGMRIRACETISGEFAEYTPNTYKGVELTAGLQFNLNKLTLGIDVLTTSFKYTEIKLGIGVNWN